MAGMRVVIHVDPIGASRCMHQFDNQDEIHEGLSVRARDVRANGLLPLRPVDSWRKIFRRVSRKVSVPLVAGDRNGVVSYDLEPAKMSEADFVDHGRRSGVAKRGDAAGCEHSTQLQGTAQSSDLTTAIAERTAGDGVAPAATGQRY